MNDNNLYQNIFIGRQPIFDRELKLFGYEILFRDANIETANVLDGDVATSKVIIDGLAIAQKGVKKDVKFFVNFTYNSLISGIPSLLPKENIVIEILEDVIIDRKILKMCIELKKKGYLLALDDYVGQITNEKLFKLVDFVKIDVLDMDFDILKKLINYIKKVNSKIKILIEKVENSTVFNVAKGFGGDYFQGFFFKSQK